MVIDSSAILAILNDEPERRAFNEAIESAESRAMSAATLVEASIVIEARFGAEGLRDLDLFIERAGIEVVPVDREQAYVARRAFSRFGKGRHAAGLNYGTVSPMRWRWFAANRSCTKGRTSVRPMSVRSCPRPSHERFRHQCLRSPSNSSGPSHRTHPTGESATTPREPGLTSLLRVLAGRKQYRLGSSGALDRPSSSRGLHLSGSPVIVEDECRKQTELRKRYLLWCRSGIFSRLP